MSNLVLQFYFLALFIIKISSNFIGSQINLYPDISIPISATQPLGNGGFVICSSNKFSLVSPDGTITSLNIDNQNCNLITSSLNGEQFALLNMDLNSSPSEATIQIFTMSGSLSLTQKFQGYEGEIQSYGIATLLNDYILIFVTNGNGKTYLDTMEWDGTVGPNFELTSTHSLQVNYNQLIGAMADSFALLISSNSIGLISNDDLSPQQSITINADTNEIQYFGIAGLGSNFVYCYLNTEGTVLCEIYSQSGSSIQSMTFPNLISNQNQFSLIPIQNGFAITFFTNSEVTSQMVISIEGTYSAFNQIQISEIASNVLASSYLNGAGYIIVYGSSNFLYAQGISPCPQPLYWSTTGCLSNFQTPPQSNSFLMSIYYEICPSSGIFSSSFCCESICPSCIGQNCSCTTAGTALNISSNICEKCPSGTTSCTISGDNFNAFDCASNYLFYNNVCCPPESTECYFQNGEAIPTLCNQFYTINNDSCCPPEYQSCYMNNAQLNISCLPPYTGINNLCCPMESNSCEIGSGGNLIGLSCAVGYNLTLNGICCPAESNCQLNSSGYVEIDSCYQSFLFLENICCPAWSSNCTYISENQTWKVGGCNLTSFNFIDGVCCPPEASSCNLQESGDFAVIACNDPYILISNLCCPPEATECQLNQAGQIEIISCTSSFSNINNQCCPPEATNCQLTQSGINATNCSSGFILYENICCPIFSKSCYLNTTDNNQIIISDCIDSYFLSENVCYPCPLNCSLCTNDPNNPQSALCTQCNSDLNMFEQTCISDCPTGLYAVNQVCCPENCINCGLGSNQCLTCNATYALNNGICIDTCPSFYTKNSDGACVITISMCEFGCDVSFLCSLATFSNECVITSPIITGIIILSAVFSLLKLFLLRKVKDESVLAQLLLNHSYSDVTSCVLVMVIFNPAIMEDQIILPAFFFYGNLLGCAFTIELFLFGFFKVWSGITLFSKNIKRVILFTYISCLLLGILDYLVAKQIEQSPYLIIGVGGLLIIFLDIYMLIRFRQFKIQINTKYYFIFPTILALTWGWASISFIGATLSDLFFWFSFAATTLNYLQPVINSLLYGPIIIELFRKSIFREFEAQNASQVVKGKEISMIESSAIQDSFKDDLRDALQL